METNSKPTLYCQMGFIEKFLALCRTSLDDLLLESGGHAETYSACFRLLYGAVNLYIDTETQTLIRHPNPLIKKLLKNPAANIQCQPGMHTQMQSDEFWLQTTTEVFMLDIPDAEAGEIEKDWGMMVLTPGNLANKSGQMLANTPIFAGQNEQTFSWNLLASQRHCFHTAVIADNYIEGDEKKLALNLVPLLMAISSGPPRKRQLHLTIITTSDGIEQIRKNLQKQIENKGIVCNLRVVKTLTLKNHDRHLITNQRWIFSGFGFTLLKWDNYKRCSVVQQSTTILCMPVVSNGYVTYKTDEDNNNPASTCFSAVRDILGRLWKIDSETPEKIGTQLWAEGERNMFRLNQVFTNNIVPN
jgi:hypothetical protein